MILDDEKIDLEIALRKLHRLQLEEGDLGAAYWLSISKLLTEADTFRQRAIAAEERLRKIHSISSRSDNSLVPKISDAT